MHSTPSKVAIGIQNLLDYDYTIKVLLCDEQMKRFRSALGALEIPADMMPPINGWIEVKHHQKDHTDFMTVLEMIEQRTKHLCK
jgi:hypothetical protein